MHLRPAPSHARQQRRRQATRHANPKVLPHPNRTRRAVDGIRDHVQTDLFAVREAVAVGLRGQRQGEGDVDDAEEEVGGRDAVLGLAVRGEGVGLGGGQGRGVGEEDEGVGGGEGEEGVEGCGELLGGG
jgi:hypothetical protein